MKDGIKAALEFDGLSSAEGLTRKSYKEDTTTQMLGIGLMQVNNEHKSKMLKENKDTHWGQTVAEFIATVESMGFYNILTVPFNSDGRSEDLICMWQEADGILLVFTTFGNKSSINGGEWHFNYIGRYREGRPSISCSNGWGEAAWQGSKDCREGMRFYISELKKDGELLPVWKASKYLSIIHYGETKEDGFWDSDKNVKVTLERLKMFPDHVQEALKIQIDSMENRLSCDE